MAAVVRGSQHIWKVSRDEEGHRTYQVSFRVETASALEGPAHVLNATGLPRIGERWIFDSDTDLWAFCHPEAEASPEYDDEACRFWKVVLKFSTRPIKRCQDVNIENPLLEPYKISGTFLKYTLEATTDRFGSPITNSAWEQMRGPQVEFDANRPQVKVEQNVADLELPLVAGLVDHVNDAPMWGLPRRCIKLSNVSWERKLYGLCYVYFTRSLEFDIDYRTFDRDLLDEGTKVLYGRWGSGPATYTGTGEQGFDWILLPINGEDPDPRNPSHFIRAVDRQLNPMHVVLNGYGIPAGSVSGKDRHYLSIRTTGNLGKALSNKTYWVPISIDPDVPIDLTPFWSDQDSYEAGAMVRIQLETSPQPVYLALYDNIDSNPTLDTGDWYLIGDTETELVERGRYSTNTSYFKNDYVLGGRYANSAGYRRVEKYPEANLLLLRVPTNLYNPY